jgi:hypothetical protein
MNPPEINNLDPQDNIPKFETNTAKPLNTNFDQNFSNGTQNVPNSVAVLVLGIVSICFCWCYGVISLITSIIALVLASSGEKEYQANPGKYTLASYKNLRAGRICAIIGLCLVGVGIILVVLYILLIGSLASNIFNLHY